MRYRTSKLGPIFHRRHGDAGNCSHFSRRILILSQGTSMATQLKVNHKISAICYLLIATRWRCISVMHVTFFTSISLNFLFFQHYMHQNSHFNKNSYIEAFPEIESDFKFVQFFYTPCILYSDNHE